MRCSTDIPGNVIQPSKKKKNEIMPPAATYKELATITLSDVSLTEEDTHRGSPHG